MLQQTQVSTVIPYFEKFIQTFPDIEMLARANLDHVLGLWSGLGYYARARNLHKTANKITLDLRCEFPSNLEALMELPGIGQSTAGAILSIAMDTSTPILDGNVKRVLARFHTLSGYPENTRVKQLFWELAEQHTPKTQFQIYTQAIMDLGATVCTRSSPNCEYCPVKANCKAFKKGTIAEYPNKKQPKEKPKKAARFFLIYNNNGEVLVEKRNSKGVWQGLWGALQRPLETEPIALCEQLGFNASTIMDQQIGNYVRGKVLEIFIVGSVTFVVLSFLGLQYAILLATMVGFSVLIPYIGAAVATIPVAIVAFFQFGVSNEFWYVIVAYGIIQLLDGNALVPLLFSEVVDLHPIAIIVAVLLFGGIWGFWGVFFAIPLATLFNAVLRALPDRHPPDPAKEPSSTG